MTLEKELGQKTKKVIIAFSENKDKYLILALLESILLLILFLNGFNKSISLIEPIVSPKNITPHSLKVSRKEIFGFAPYWVFDGRLDNIDWNTLTTFAFFGIPVKADGNLDKNHQGYRTFHGKKAGELFEKAKKSGTRVVLTLTQMDNATIKDFLDDPQVWANTKNQVIREINGRGLDGINIDFEYLGDPGSSYRRKFSNFVAEMSDSLHREIPGSVVSVSVYASSARDNKLYDIKKLAGPSDRIFMMAYDYATTTAARVMPTSPLYGFKEGKYWYDVATAVEDFLKYMAPEKLILGIPWYGYSYVVSKPANGTPVNRGYYIYRRKGRRTVRVFIPVKQSAQTAAALKNQLNKNAENSSAYLSGWDELGQVGWQAYRNGGSWRMIFIEDTKSLGVKYDFAFSKNLGGIGIWALGFDEGPAFWQQLAEKFSHNLADNSLTGAKL